MVYSLFKLWIENKQTNNQAVRTGNIFRNFDWEGKQKANEWGSEVNEKFYLFILSYKQNDHE